MTTRWTLMGGAEQGSRRDAALARLREECEARGKATMFATLGPFLSREPLASDYDTASEKLGIAARSVAVAVQRLYADYRAMVR